jgi:two-component system chemotaxis response regulator CheY
MRLMYSHYLFSDSVRRSGTACSILYLRVRVKKRSFALILSDINMPGMSGIEMLSRIRHTYKNPPPIVMMISAYGDDENRAHAEHSGASDFLTKPVDFVGLKEKLTALIVG